MTIKETSWSDSLVTFGFGAIIALTAFFLISPLLMIVPMSFSSGRYLDFPPPGWSLQWYYAFFTNPDWTSSFWVSLEVALMATALSMALGVPAAFALVRSNLPFKAFFLAFFSLPLVFPVIASAVALYYVFTSLHLIGTRFGLALAHTILALPVVILPMTAALQRFDERLEWQALNLGASRWQTLWTVTFPLLRPVLLTVMLFAFVTSFDEVIFAIFLSSGSTATLPKRIWEGLRFEIQPTVTVVATFMLLISTVVIALVALFQRKAGFLSPKIKESDFWNPIT
jgi:ABC-type spermidine/putrescine transport system permease subunit II